MIYEMSICRKRKQKYPDKEVVPMFVLYDKKFRTMWAFDITN